jgi:ATP-binding cassette subfamily B protein
MTTAPAGRASLVLRYVLRYRGSALIMVGLLVTSIALEVAEPQVAAYFIERAQDRAALSTLTSIAMLFLLVAVTEQMTSVVANYRSKKIAWSATNDLRADLALHVLKLDITFHEEHSPGELISRIDGDVNEMAEFFSSFVVQILGNVLLLLGVLAILTVLNLWLGLTAIAVSAAGFVLLVLPSAAGARAWQAERENNARFSGYLVEAMQAREDLRSSGAVSYAMARFHAILRGWLPVTVRAAGWGSTVWMAATVMLTATSLVAFAFGGGLYHRGVLSLSEVYLAVAYAAMLAMPMEAIRGQLQYFQKASAALTRVAELIHTEHRIADGHLSLPAGPLDVEFRDVTFAYQRPEDPSSAALRNVSFRIPAGRTVGLAGRTGAGKTTVASLLFRRRDVSEGMITTGGIDIAAVRLADLRARIGYVSQDVQVFTASVRDNITFFDPDVPDSRLLGILDALKMRDWLAGLPEGLGTRIAQGSVSAGEAQLIALARVFLKDPGVVVLDEPSSRLDPATEAIVDAALSVLCEQRTTLIIAHRLDSLRRASHLLVMGQGRIVGSGEPGALLAGQVNLIPADALNTEVLNTEALNNEP